MARRVNTKFVVILSSALVGTVGIFAGVKGYRMLQARNPAVVEARGEAAEKSGDLKTAAGDYGSAGNLMSVKHIPGADTLFARSADLWMKLSREAKTQDDAVTFYQQAMTNYNNALAENPQNKEVNQTLLEEDYQNALFQPSPAAWKTVETVAGKLIDNQDGAKPRLYRAEARLNLAPTTTDLLSIEGAAAISTDLAKALAFEPKSGKAVTLEAQLAWMRAGVLANQRGLSTDEFATDRRYLGEVAGVRQMLMRYLENREDRLKAPGWNWFTNIPLAHVDPDVAVALASMSISQYQLTGGRDRGRVDAAVVLLEAAFSADPARTALADGLGQLYVGTGQPGKAEELFKGIVRRAPENPEGYYRLAVFYMDTGNVPAAIASFGDVTAHPLIGIGREAARNYQYRFVAFHEIGWLNMELAERPGTGAPLVQGYLKAAADATEQLRAMSVPRGLVYLLDGRMQLIKGDTPRAIATLKSAESSLSGSDVPLYKDRLRATELLLAQANEQENQLGAALELVKKAQAIRADASGQVAEGRLLMRLGRFDEAGLLMGKLLGAQKDKEGNTVFTAEKALPPSIAEEATSLYGLALERQSGNLKVFTGNNLQTALLEIDAGQYADALNDAKAALAKAATNSDAENISAYQVAINCCVQLKQTDDAKAYAAAALAKFPQNTSFQVAKAQLDQPGGLDSLEAQKAVVDAISDPFTKSMQLAALYHRQPPAIINQAGQAGRALTAAELKQCEGYWDQELKVLQDAHDSLKDAGTREDRDKLNSVLDRMFTAALTAYSVSDEPQKSGYIKMCPGIVGEIEKLNLDGTSGLIYQGRLELAEGKDGMPRLKQAVQERPDYAYAHMVLGQAYLQQANKDMAAGAASSTSNFESALEELRQVINLAPNNLLALQLAIEVLVQRGDSSSLKEAQTDLESGLAQSPHNSVFISYSEIFTDKVEDSIKMRLELQQRQPDDRNNLRRLEILYVRLKNKDVQDAAELARRPEAADGASAKRAAAQDAMNNAIAIAKADYEKHPDELATADFLAHLYAEDNGDNNADDRDDKWAARAGAAIELYGKFLASPDPATKFNALIVKAEFFRTLALPGDTIARLVKAQEISHDNLRAEAEDILQQAIKIEPETQDDAERHLADLFFDELKYPEAEKQYGEVLAKNKNPQASDRVTRRLIECQLREGQIAEAMPRLTTLLAKTPNDIQGLILRAYAKIQQGQAAAVADQPKALNEALVDLNHVLELDPGNPDALLYRAMAEISLGDKLETAEKDLIEAAKRDKLSVSARILLADLYVRSQRFEEASRTFRDILADHPDAIAVRAQYTDLLMQLAELQVTLPADSTVEYIKSLRRLGPAEKLNDELLAAKQMYPNDPRWYFKLADLFTLEGDDAKARTYYEALYHAVPTDASICDAYLGSLLKTKDYQKAVDFANTLIKGSADFIAKNPQFVSFYLKRAAAYQALGKPDDAVKDIDQAFAIGVTAVNSSRDFGPFIAVLNEAASTGPGQNAGAVLNPDLVAQRLRLRIAANPTETISKIGLIQALLIKNDNAGALQVVDTMTPPPENDKDNVNLRYLVLRESALVRAQTKHFDAAEKDYQALEKMTPLNVEVLNNHAFMLAEWGHAKEAVAEAEKALGLMSTRADPTELSTGLANLYDTLGWAYYLNNETDNAVANLRKSAAVQPQAPAYLHLARALQKQGNPEEALTNYDTGAQMAQARHDDETLAALVETGVPLAVEKKDVKVLAVLLKAGVGQALAQKDSKALAALAEPLAAGIRLAKDAGDDKTAAELKDLQAKTETAAARP